MHPLVIEGIQLFNMGKFFEAHEVLETVWLQADGEDRVFLHGVIQVAAAFHHYTRRNQAGFRSLLEKGCRKLESVPDAKQGIDLPGLLAQLQPWRDQFREGPGHHQALPPLPHIARGYPEVE